MELSQDAKVLQLTWYIPDDWYGTNKRIILIPEEGRGFVNAKEAKPYMSLFRTFVKQKYSQKEKPGMTTFSSCPTYRYCSAGPSYTCTNVIITIAKLEAFKEEWENSPEYKAKQAQAEYRRDLKEMRASFIPSKSFRIPFKRPSSVPASKKMVKS